MEKRVHIWYDNIEENLVEQVFVHGKSLWKMRTEKDMEKEQMHEVEDIRDIINNRYKSGFTYEMILKKWLEIRLLFDLKYVMNGSTMEDRGHHIRRDGSVKDDLNESWKLFKQLEFLVNPNYERPKKS